MTSLRALLENGEHSEKIRPEVLAALVRVALAAKVYMTSPWPDPWSPTENLKDALRDLDAIKGDTR
jgi:hypothetical protein